jgi:hypothetical protein
MPPLRGSPLDTTAPTDNSHAQSQPKDSVMPDQIEITRDDIRAMRMADNVHFHTYQGRSWLVAELRNYGAARIYTATEQRLFTDTQKYSGERSREIPVATQRLEDYSGRTGDYEAFAMWCPKEVWLTIVAALRPSDTLGFHWVASNNSESMEAVGYHHDQLRLLASNSDRKSHRAWIVRDEFGPDNSARMIKRRLATRAINS